MLVSEKMTIYLFGEVQPQRKSRHFLMRARQSRVKLCAVGMRNAIQGNNLKIASKSVKTHWSFMVNNIIFCYNEINSNNNNNNNNSNKNNINYNFTGQN